MDQKKNQGFSLVELIVVIAIMAVLVGVLAPAYLKYVEKSRKSSDISSISDILSAAEKVAVDVQFNLGANDKFVCTITNGVCVLTVGTDATGASATDSKTLAAAQTEWNSIALSGAANYTCKSSDFKTQSVTITGKVQADGSVKWSTSAKPTLITYSKDFQTKFFSE